MALFRDINCAHCGKKTALLTRTKLSDGQYVCARCTQGIPNELAQALEEDDYEAFVELRTYMDVTNKKYEKQFHENHCYLCIHLDSQHGLFYLDGMRPRVYFRLEELSRFDLSFHPDEVNEGIFSTNVTGKVYIELEVSTPRLFKEEVIEDVKAPAKVKGLLNNKVTYDNPKGMDDFLHYFTDAWYRFLQERINQIDAEFQNNYNEFYSTEQNGQSSELREAMNLFMLDDLNDVTLDVIKSQRNRLMMTFHPDHGDHSDNVYAQKINHAYAILKAHIS